MTNVERFQLGVDKYGWDSEFRRTVEEIINTVPIDNQKLLKYLEEQL